jgi:AraC-like DNA-binding protein
VEKRRRQLEDFFLEQYRAFDHPDLFRSFESLTDADCPVPVAEIARSLGMCHKTLTRLYQRHLGTAPVVLRRIARFRRSIELSQNRAGAGQLTQIAHLANYYDQPHLIREFHEFTGESPARFFRHVSAMGTRDILWRML